MLQKIDYSWVWWATPPISVSGGRGRRIASSRPAWVTQWDSVLKKKKKDRDKHTHKEDGGSEQGDRGHGHLLKLLDLLPFWINYLFSKTNKKPHHASQHFHLKLIYWDIYAKTVNAYYTDGCCRSPILIGGGAEKKLFPLVMRSSLDKCKNTRGMRPRRSFSVQTFTHAASDNWASKRTTDLPLKDLALAWTDGWERIESSIWGCVCVRKDS